MSFYPDFYKVPDCLKLPIGKPSLEEQIRLLQKNTEEKREEEKIVGYRLKHVNHLSHVSHYIDENSNVRCYPGYLLRPDKYYVLGVEYQRSIFNFEQRMSAFYEAEEKTKPRQLEKRTPKQKEVKPDFVFVVCATEDGNWHRCKVIQQIGQNECEVFLLDSGVSLSVGIPNLRYIHKDFISFPVQSIAIKVSDEELVSKIKLADENMDTDTWARKIFNTVIGNQLLLVHFKQRVTDNEGTCVWKADASVINQMDMDVIWPDAYMELKNRIKLFKGF